MRRSATSRKPSLISRKSSQCVRISRRPIWLAAVRAWVAAAREDNPLASVHHVAHELVSFAMFCAGSALPREDELRLSRDVNSRLQAIRVPS